MNTYWEIVIETYNAILARIITAKTGQVACPGGKNSHDSDDITFSCSHCGAAV